MPDILPFLKHQHVFEPEVTHAMSVAFEEVCRTLKLNGDAQAREAVAVRIIALAQRGEHDPKQLCERVLKEANGDDGSGTTT